MNKKFWQNTTNTVLAIIIVLGLIGLVNFFFSDKILRLDLTEEKTGTLSEGTVALIKKLDDRLTIKACFSEKLSPELLRCKKVTEDILKEYENYGRGKIFVEHINVKAGDDKLKEELKKIGIRPVSIRIGRPEKEEVESGVKYMSLAIFYGDNLENIPWLGPSAMENLEYEISSKIYKAYRNEQILVGFLRESNSRPALNRNYEIIQSKLKEYNFVDINTAEGEQAISDRIKLLIVPGPEDIKERVKYQIDQYIMRGGRVIFLVDTMFLDIVQKPQAPPARVRSGLDDLFERYGFIINNDLVLQDAPCEPIQISVPGAPALMGPYPYWFIISKGGNWGQTGLNSQHPVTSKLDAVSFSWASSIDIIPNKESAVKSQVLASSSPGSWVRTEQPYLLDPREDLRKKDDILKSYNLAVLFSGVFKSLYADKPVPPSKNNEKKDEKKDDKSKEKPPVVKKDEPLKISKNTYIMVISDADIISNFHLQRSGCGPKNITFFANILDYLCKDETLIGIRSREKTYRPVDPRKLAGSNKAKMLIINVLIIPLLIIAAGLLRFWFRMKKTKG